METSLSSESKDALWARFFMGALRRRSQHLADFVAAYNFGRRLKTLKGLTPYEFPASQPQSFTLNPLHQMPGLNT